MKTLNLLFSFIILFGFSFALHAQAPWQQQTGETPPARFGHTMVKINNKLYVYGGVSTARGEVLNDLWSYNETNGEWEDLKPVNAPEGRKYHAAATKDGKMYVFMGETETTGITQEVWEYDPQANTWTQKNNGGPQVPLMRIHHCAVSGPDKIWITGGKLSEIFDDTWAYDVVTQKWEKGASFNGARYGHVTYFNDVNFIIFGGADDQGFKNDMQSYDIASDQWSTVQCTGTVPQNIKFSAHAGNNDILWVAGGTTKVNGTYPEVNTTYEYSISKKQWIKKSDGPAFTMGTGAVLTHSKSDNYETMIFGGTRQGQALDEAWVYNLANDPLSGLPEIGIDSPVNIYPTYTTGQLTIKGRKKISKVAVYNLQGQLILMQEANDTKLSIDLNGNRPGAYFIKVYSDKLWFGGKVILTK